MKDIWITYWEHYLTRVREDYNHIVYETTYLIETYKYNCYSGKTYLNVLKYLQEVVIHKRIIEIKNYNSISIQNYNSIKKDIIDIYTKIKTFTDAKYDKCKKYIKVIYDVLRWKARFAIVYYLIDRKYKGTMKLCNEWKSDYEQSSFRFSESQMMDKLLKAEKEEMRTHLNSQNKSKMFKKKSEFLKETSFNSNHNKVSNLKNLKNQKDDIQPSFEKSCLSNCQMNLPTGGLPFPEVNDVYVNLINLSLQMSQVYDDMFSFLEWLLKYKNKISIMRIEISEIEKRINTWKVKRTKIITNYEECHSTPNEYLTVAEYHKYYLNHIKISKLIKYMYDEYYFFKDINITQINFYQELVPMVKQCADTQLPDDYDYTKLITTFSNVVKSLYPTNPEFMHFDTEGCPPIQCPDPDDSSIVTQSQTKLRPCYAISQIDVDTTDTSNAQAKEGDEQVLECYYTELVSNRKVKADQVLKDGEVLNPEREVKQNYAVVKTRQLNPDGSRGSPSYWVCEANQLMHKSAMGVGLIYLPEQPIFNVSNYKECQICGGPREEFTCRISGVAYYGLTEEGGIRPGVGCLNKLDFLVCVVVYYTAEKSQPSSLYIVRHTWSLVEGEDTNATSVVDKKTVSVFFKCQLSSNFAEVIKFDLTDGSLCEQCEPYENTLDFYIYYHTHQEDTESDPKLCMDGYVRDVNGECAHPKNQEEKTPDPQVPTPDQRDVFNPSDFVPCGIYVDRRTRTMYREVNQDINPVLASIMDKTVDFCKKFVDPQGKKKIQYYMNPEDQIFIKDPSNSGKVLNDGKNREYIRKFFMAFKKDENDYKCLYHRFLSLKSLNNKGVGLMRLNWEVSEPKAKEKLLALHKDLNFSFKNYYFDAIDYDEHPLDESLMLYRSIRRKVQFATTHSCSHIQNQILRNRDKEIKINCYKDDNFNSGLTPKSYILQGFDYMEEPNPRGNNNIHWFPGFAHRSLYNYYNALPAMYQLKSHGQIYKSEESIDDIYIENEKSNAVLRYETYRECFIKFEMCMYKDPEGLPSYCNHVPIWGGLNFKYGNDGYLLKDHYWSFDEMKYDQDLAATPYSGLQNDFGKRDDIQISDYNNKDLHFYNGFNSIETAFDESAPDGITKTNLKEKKDKQFWDYVFTDIHYGLYADYFTLYSTYVNSGDYKLIEKSAYRLTPQPAELLAYLEDKVKEKGDDISKSFEICLYTDKINTQEPEMFDIYCMDLNKFLDDFTKPMKSKLENYYFELDYSGSVPINCIHGIQEFDVSKLKTMRVCK